jgi:tetratricopeptide (TPR) repeat protein
MLVTQAACGKTPADGEAVQIDTARSAFVSGEYLLAEDLYQRYLESYAHGKFRTEAWERLADISQYARNAPAKTATLLDAALLEFGQDATLRQALRLRVARIRLSLRQYDKAAAQYRFLLDDKTASADFFCAVSQEFAEGLLKAHDPQAALDVLRHCQGSLPDGEQQARCTLSLALLLVRLQRQAEAEPILSALYAATAIDATSRARAGFALASLLETRHETAAAKALYEKLRETYPNHLVIERKLRYLQ